MAITRISRKSCSVPLLGFRGSVTSPKQHTRLAPVVLVIPYAQKTRVDPISCGFTRPWHKAMNVNGFPFPDYDDGDYVVRVARPWCERLQLTYFVHKACGVVKPSEQHSAKQRPNSKTRLPKQVRANSLCQVVTLKAKILIVIERNIACGFSPLLKARRWDNSGSSA